MTAGVVAELLADLLGPAPSTPLAEVGANAANPANRVHPCALATTTRFGECVRTGATGLPPDRPAGAESHRVARARTGDGGSPTLRRREDSQDSQRDRGASVDVAAEGGALGGWTPEDIQRFIVRRDRLLRWGWQDAEAEAMAERLTMRDRSCDPRVCCLECRQHHQGRCNAPAAAGLQTPVVSRDLAALLQRCHGFEPLSPTT